MTQPTPNPSNAEPLVPTDPPVAATPIIEPPRLVIHFGLSDGNQLAAGLLTLTMLLSLWCSASRSSGTAIAENAALDRQFEQQIDLNIATPAELELLDGIGPATGWRRRALGRTGTLPELRR